jgi:hypothetical protein
MKNLFKLSIVLFITSIILSSCNSNLSITKRRYSKGYFVERHSNKHNENQEKTKVAKHRKTEPVRVLTNNELVKTEPVKQNTSESRVITAEVNAEKPAKKTSEIKTNEAKPDLVSYVKNPVKTFKDLSGKIGTAATGDDALSLLWILILILLIIYVAGLLFDNFGLGSLIHVLAVIALVLLILWLLRIL